MPFDSNHIVYIYIFCECAATLQLKQNPCCMLRGKDIYGRQKTKKNWTWRRKFYIAKQEARSLFEEWKRYIWKHFFKHYFLPFNLYSSQKFDFFLLPFLYAIKIYFWSEEFLAHLSFCYKIFIFLYISHTVDGNNNNKNWVRKKWTWNLHQTIIVIAFCCCCFLMKKLRMISCRWNYHIVIVLWKSHYVMHLERLFNVLHIHIRLKFDRIYDDDQKRAWILASSILCYKKFEDVKNLLRFQW